MIRKVQLLSPSGPEFPDLLLGPGSTYNIRTNKDHSHTVHYSVLDGVDVLAISSGKWCSLHSIGTCFIKSGSEILGMTECLYIPLSK